jgi:hypothetical protein
MQPGWTHTLRVFPPCLTQSPRACALVVQPGCPHTAWEPPPCLLQSPRAFALVVQPQCTHTCLWHRASRSSRDCFSGAAWMHAHSPSIPTVFGTESSFLCVGGAPRHCTQPFGTVLVSAATCSQPLLYSLQSGTTHHVGGTRPSLGPAWCILQLCTSDLFFFGPGGFFCTAASPPPSPSSPAGAADALRRSRASPPSHPFRAPRRRDVAFHCLCWVQLPLPQHLHPVTHNRKRK